MTGLLVVPVDDINVTVWAITKVDEAGPCVVGHEKIRAVRGNIPGSGRLENIHIQPAAVDIPHEKTIVIALGPRPTKVNHRSTMRMPAPGGIRFVIAAVGIGTQIVSVVGNGRNVGVGVRVEVRTSLALVTGARHNMECVWNHTRLNERFTPAVEIEAPRVGGSVRHHIKHVTGRVVAPDPGIDSRALVVWGSRFTNAAMGENTMTTPQPAIGPP